MDPNGAGIIPTNGSRGLASDGEHMQISSDERALLEKVSISMAQRVRPFLEVVEIMNKTTN